MVSGHLVPCGFLSINKRLLPGLRCVHHRPRPMIDHDMGPMRMRPPASACPCTQFFPSRIPPKEIQALGRTRTHKPNGEEISFQKSGARGHMDLPKIRHHSQALKKFELNFFCPVENYYRKIRRKKLPHLFMVSWFSLATPQARLASRLANQRKLQRKGCKIAENEVHKVSRRKKFIIDDDNRCW